MPLCRHDGLQHKNLTIILFFPLFMTVTSTYATRHTSCPVIFTPCYFEHYINVAAIFFILPTMQPSTCTSIAMIRTLVNFFLMFEAKQSTNKQLYTWINYPHLHLSSLMCFSAMERDCAHNITVTTNLMSTYASLEYILPFCCILK